ncbi:MAG TPA: hypothetical protein VFJ24_07970, partial [Gaiellales bacterium]|nr:hypothetical protein [Gaiellales bacterium]
SCALLATGEVRCWGDNSVGQLGIGTSTGFATAPAAPVALAAPAVAVSAGWAHTCAVLVDATVACWGYGGEGQLGASAGASSSTPVAVPGVANVVQISAGPANSCTVNAAGAVKCWPSSPFAADPYDVIGFPAPVASVSTGGTKTHLCSPIPRSGLEVCQKVATVVELWHACAVLTTGAAKCWGSNGSGQLGDGTTSPRIMPADVSTLSSGGAQVSAGGYRTVPLTYIDPVVYDHHTCAVTAAGTVKCWGRNKCDVLGNVGVGDCTSLNPRIGITPDDVVGIVATPVDVAGLAGIQSVAAGGEFACALSSTGRVSCWGLGYGGTPLAVLSGTPPAGTIVNATNPRLGNISTRAKVLTGDDVVIAGFVVGGSTGKTVAIQVAGPALFDSEITAPLPNPRITLVRSSDQSVVATNDDWVSAANASQIQDSGFAPRMANETAIVATLAPGAYTAIVSGSDGGTGIGVVGVFELDHPETPLVNISTRAHTQLIQSDVLIAGFVVQGASPQQVAVTVAGPSLRAAGITNALANPMLVVARPDGALIALNDDWQSDAAAAQLQAAGFAPADPAEPGVPLTLDPGPYTAIVRSTDGTTGVAVVGVFAVP